MSSVWTWPGARWWRCDLHLHTPASHDFRDQALTPEAWVEAACEAGLDVVAVTDHNTAGWVEKIQRAASRAPHPLVVFPGVELSVGDKGVHLLALFDPGERYEAVSNFMARCGIPSQKYGAPEAFAKCLFADALESGAEQKVVLIAAHVDAPKGLLKELSGVQLEEALQHRGLLAAEINSEGDIGLKPVAKLARVTFSDAHRTAHIGNRSTWLKMTRPDAEGLRLALLDRELSVRPATTDLDPNCHAELAIESIEVSGTLHLGRPEPFVLNLNPWLNAIIGGRGTGKSSIVELLRIVLRREGELPKALRTGFDEFRQIPTERGAKGVLTEATEIRAIYRKYGARFRIRWQSDGSGETIEKELPDDGGWSPATGDIAQRFPVRIFSQKQIFELARDSAALLRIVDDAPQVGFAEWETTWDQEERNFFQLRTKIREHDAKLRQRASLQGHLDDVERKLAVFERAGHAEVLSSFQLHRRQQRALEEWAEAIDGNGERLRQVAEELTAPLLDHSLFEADPAGLEVLEAAQKVAESLGSLKRQTLELAAAADRQLADWRVALEATSWPRAAQKAREDYEKLSAQLEAEGSMPDSYGVLVQERQRVESQLRGIDALDQDRKQLESDAAECLDRLASLRLQLTSKRRLFLEQVLADNRLVKIEVLPFGDIASSESDLRKVLRCDDTRFQRDLGSAEDPGSLLGDLGDPRVADFEKRLAALKQRIEAIALQNPGIEVKDQRFAKHLAALPPEMLDQLAVWHPKDSLSVSFSPQGDGKKFQPIEQGSPGQKTAALLAFLLSYGNDEPIVLDQPEDDLDNRLIYDLVVAQLRGVKTRRQILVVTHNANIVVNADAELVVALDVRRGQTRAISAGGLQEQEVRDQICQIMEGGKEAFDERYRRIGGSGGHVR